MGATRRELIRALTRLVVRLRQDHPPRVGLDGVDAAGKTTLADELARSIEAAGRPVVRASIDGFHRPRAIRYRQGPESPRGYFEDSFDYRALRSTLLAPLGPNGDRRFRRRVFDHRTDLVVNAPWEVASPDSILLFDGVFLHHPEISSCWDLTVFVRASFETTLDRALERDRTRFGSVETVRDRYLRRYVPGQRIYLEECDPERAADIVVDNDDPERPSIVRAAGTEVVRLSDP